MKVIKWILAVITGLIFILVATYLLLLGLRPDRANLEAPLYQGIHYQRIIKDSPRPMVLHVIKISLDAPGISLMVTPFDRNSASNHYQARTTSDFLKENNVQVAINASFFYPFEENTPWDFYPKSNEPVTAVGFVTSNQQTQSTSGATFSQLCIGKTVSIEPSGCPADSAYAVSGSSVFVKDGKLSAGKKPIDTRPYPRTAVGLDSNGKTMWLVVVDGKQKNYSEGITMRGLGQFMIELGADSALNLDGGGSSTIGIRTEDDIKILNSPIHTHIPLRQRPVANHLGISANSLAHNARQ